MYFGKGVRHMSFTREEFDCMVQQLLCPDGASFDMLSHIAQKTLYPYVRKLCCQDPNLCHQNLAEDIMQEIHLRLMMTTVTGFLLNREDGALNDDPDGFRAWMYKVATNRARDFAKQIRTRQFRQVDPQALETVAVYDPAPEMHEESVTQLKKAFAIVLSANVRVYKVLTWLAQSVYFLEQDTSRIDSNAQLIAEFENKTLREMYDMILLSSARIPWLQVTQRQHHKIMADLDKPWKGEQTYGQTCYKEFFMKHNGEVSGKKSISDWVNRMDELVKNKLET